MRRQINTLAGLSLWYVCVAAAMLLMYRGTRGTWAELASIQGYGITTIGAMGAALAGVQITGSAVRLGVSGVTASVFGFHEVIRARLLAAGATAVAISFIVGSVSLIAGSPGSIISLGSALAGVGSSVFFWLLIGHAVGWIYQGSVAGYVVLLAWMFAEQIVLDALGASPFVRSLFPLGAITTTMSWLSFTGPITGKEPEMMQALDPSVGWLAAGGYLLLAVLAQYSHRPLSVKVGVSAR